MSKNVFLIFTFLIISLISVSVVSAVCTAPPANMVSWWRAEGDATDIIDGNNGILQSGATFAPGKVGQAFSLSGGFGGYVQVSHNSNLNLGSGDYTLDAWIKTSGSSSNQFVMQKGDTSTATHFGMQVAHPLSNNRLLCTARSSIAASTTLVIGTTNLADNVFHHVACVREGGFLKAYVDGVLENQAALISPGSVDTNANLFIGASDTISDRFKGLIDEVGIFNRALSAPEVASIFNADSAGQCVPGLPYSADFESTPVGSLPAGVSLVSGTASVQSDTQRDGTTGHVLRLGASPSAVKITGAGSNQANFTASFDTNGVVTQFYFRAADTNNGYVFQYTPGHPVGFHLYKLVGGTLTTLASLSAPAGWKRMTVEAQGNTITVHDNDKSMIRVTDSTFSSGSFFFKSGSGFNMVVDNLAIDTKSVASNTPATPTSLPFSTGFDTLVLRDGVLQQAQMELVDGAVTYPQATQLNGAVGTVMSLSGSISGHSSIVKVAGVGSQADFTASFDTNGVATQFFFRAANANNGYFVAYTPGHPEGFALYKIVGGAYTRLAVLAAPAGWKRITVEAVGSQITVHDNDKSMIRVTDSTFSSGSFFFQSGSSFNTVVDNLAIDTKTVASNTPATPTSLPFSTGFDTLVLRDGVLQQAQMELVDGAVTYPQATQLNGAVGTVMSLSGSILGRSGMVKVAGVGSQADFTASFDTNGVVTQFYFRAANANNGYVFQHTPGHPVGFHLYKLVGGTLTTLASLPAPAGWKRMTVEAQGNTITVSDGVSVLFTANDNTFSSGSFFFRSGSTLNAVVDNLAIGTCGDSVVQPLGELCDDGNTVGGDGCDVQCKTEVCGNGVVQPLLGEQCDNGNVVNGDGCSNTCQLVCVAPPANMVSWWQAEGDALDSQDGNNGVLVNGATFAAGKVGQAFSLDGVNDYVNVVDSASLDIVTSTGLTLDAWVKVNGVNEDGYILSKYDGTGGGYGIYWEGSLDRVVLTFNTPSTQINSAGVFVDSNVWTHVAVTVDSSGNFVFYRNGVAVSSGSGVNLLANNLPVRIGTRPGSNDGNTVQHLNALVDEVEILNRALSASEIAAIYNAGSAGKCLVVDSDNDGAFDDVDNCLAAFNPDQLNSDADANGDLCDACPADTSNTCNPANSGAAFIDSTGGTVTVPSDGIKLVVPPGALVAGQTISITEDASNPPGSVKILAAGRGNIVTSFVLEPAGTVFSIPAQLVFHWNDLLPNDAREDNLGFFEHIFIPLKDFLFANDAAACFAETPADPDHDGNKCTEFDATTGVDEYTLSITGFSTFSLIAITDSDSDGVFDRWDLNQDGDFDDVNERDDCPNVAGTVASGCPGAIDARVTVNTVGKGTPTGQQPAANVLVKAFNRADSCVSSNFPDEFAIVSNCEEVARCTTGSDGLCTLGVVPGDYEVIAETETFQGKYPGHPVDTVVEGGRVNARLAFMIKPDNNVDPARTNKKLGSELLIYSPAEVYYDNQIYYAFVFESIGDWEVDVCAEVPAGYTLVGDQTCSQAFVNNEVKSLLFEYSPTSANTITGAAAKDIRDGKDLGATLTIKHKGKVMKEAHKAKALKRGEALNRAKGQKVTGSTVASIESTTLSTITTLSLIVALLALLVAAMNAKTASESKKRKK